MKGPMGHNSESWPARLKGLTERLKIVFDDPDLLELAMTHKSYYASFRPGRDNQRLEFLGDAVLGIYISEMVYQFSPDFSEGQMSRIRAAVVNESSLAALAGELDLGRYLRLGAGEQSSGGRSKPSILADALEAIIGGYYLSNGPRATRSLVRRLWKPLIIGLDLKDTHLADFKTRLQELTQSLGLGVPDYVMIEQSGPDNNRIFTMEVKVPGRISVKARGRTKKAASQLAAQAMLGQILKEK